MERIAIIGGARTPFVKAGGKFANYSFLDLGAEVTRAAIKKLALDPHQIDEIIFSTVLLDPRAPNFAREIVFRAGLPKGLSAHSVTNNCISGLVAINVLGDSIRTGRVKIGLAGGAESMSRPTLSLQHKAEAFFLALARARSLSERLKVAASFKLKYLFPIPPSPKEPSTGLTMGEHCELMAKEFGIARELQDKRAFKSHSYAAKAAAEGAFADQIVPLGGVTSDNLVRGDTTLEKLAKLSPVFDRSAAGTITAGNASALTDGASIVCLMAESTAKAQGRKILGYVEAVEFSAVAPEDGLLMAPALALPNVLARTKLTIADIDLFEIHEAFAAQVEANLVAWKNGWSKYPQIKPIGEIPEEKINRCGGSLAIGHPFAATGGRLVLSAVEQLAKSGGKRAAISVCAAGGMACAMIISRE